jgi:hypothetical protein
MEANVNITLSTAAAFTLGSVASLRAGYSFRSAIRPISDGPVRAVQLKDFMGGVRLSWKEVIRTRLPRSPADSEWLRHNDILFAFRGTRLFASVLEDVPGPTVASTQFMIIRVEKPELVLPEFLAWQLNQPPAQHYFERSAAGTAQRSLRRAAIEDTTIAIPPLALQQSVVQLSRLAEREQAVFLEVLAIRKQQLNRIAADLMTAVGARQSE